MLKELRDVLTRKKDDSPEAKLSPATREGALEGRCGFTEQEMADAVGPAAVLPDEDD